MPQSLPYAQPDAETDTLRIRVRYDEIDRMGITYHPRYLTYFEMGRSEWLRRRGLTHAALEDQGVFFAVIEADARYLKPAKYDDVLEVRTTLVAASGVTVTFRSEIWRDDVKLTDGSVRLACVDTAGKPRRLPSALRKREEDHRHP